MPTGYTAKLYEGTEQTFPDFLLSCAHAFGALILLRDSDPDAPIPTFEPRVEYHDTAIAKAKADLFDLAEMTDAECAAKAQAEFDHIRGERERSGHERIDRQGRYEAMLAQVREWEPPTTDHEGLKQFMVDQLEESIRFDCSPIDWPEYPKLTAAKWRAEKLAKAERDLAHHEKERAEEVERTAHRNAWVKALRESIP